MDRDVLSLIPPYLPDQQFIFKQDNCSIHQSAYSRMFFLRRGIKTLDWLSRCPDFNICENIFAYLYQKLYSGGKTYKNKDDL